MVTISSGGQQSLRFAWSRPLADGEQREMENDEPCVCDTDFTCLADEHDSEA